VTGGDLFPVESAGDFESEMVILKADIPWKDDSPTTWGGSGGAMNYLWTGDTKAESGAGSRDGMAPFSAIFGAILLIAIGGLSGGVIATGDPSLMPLMNMTMEARDYDGACIVVFRIKRKAGGEGVGTMTCSDEFGKVEI